MNRKTQIIALVVVTLLAAASGVYAWYFDDRILPHTWIGTVPVGGLTLDEAAGRVVVAGVRLADEGIQLSIEGSSQPINPETVGFILDPLDAVDAAFRRGREGTFVVRTGALIASLWKTKHIEPPIAINEVALRAEIADIATATGTGSRDVRLAVTGTNVRLLTDTAPGKSIDQEEAATRITSALRRLETATITAQLREEAPRGDPATGAAAVESARAILARPLTLRYEELQYTISRAKIGTWITTEYEGSTIHAALDHAKIALYVTGIATAINVGPEPPQLTTSEGRITGFAPSKIGKSVEESKLTASIVEALMSRAAKTASSDVVAIPVKATQMTPVGLDLASGITELIGTATTPFTGSPKNRILNIKNGVRFLTGTVIQPGALFSTLETLGVIDNTTGYLPEMVIKGDRTTPEFGGGLCQVSTTLFRAVLNAGLPVIERRNHSYRVTYYEHDGAGAFIGPGLDATIYQPDVDMKFRNDTSNPVLIIGYVIGDKVTFELYGTRDGRTSHLDGPHLLTETPAGSPVYIETQTLAPGVTRQVEVPHPGGSSIATYTVTYADGKQVKKVFRSWYRPWPPKFLIGVPKTP